MHASAAYLQSYDPGGAATAALVDALWVLEPDADTPHLLLPRAEVELVVRFGPA
jgi:hypothetical protein